MLGALASSLLAPLMTFGYHEVVEELDAPRSLALESAHTALWGQGFNPDTDVDLLIVVDFDRPSFTRRLVVYDRGQCPVQKCLVSHGSGNADPTKRFATRFSNVPGSEMMSLGLFVVSGDRPSGKFGRSIEIDGLDRGVNHLAKRRLIVIHPAHYVSYASIAENFVEELNPRLGQSRGCPALRQQDFTKLLTRIREVRQAKGRVFLFAHRSIDPPWKEVLPEVSVKPLTKKLEPIDLDALTIPAWP